VRSLPGTATHGARPGERHVSEENHRATAHADIPEGALVWDVDPISVALDESAVRREDRHHRQDHESCIEVGRGMLLAQFTFSSWVLRRVEKVKFASDRRIGRSSSIEFRIPDQAPVICTSGGEPHWLIPLSVMRRHTLVNLDLRTEEDHGVSLLGLRFTQKLDEAMLRAAARLACPEAATNEAIDLFIHDVIAGTWRTVQERLKEYDAWRDNRGSDSSNADPLNAYFQNSMFRASLERMWHNFTLYVMLPVAEGKRRVLRLAFEERVEWRYQVPNLKREQRAEAKRRKDTREVWEYKPLAKRPAGWRGPLHFLGLRATRVRFLTPNAVAWHAKLFGADGHWTSTQVTSIVLLLVTVCGGASTYVAQHSSGDVAARMVTGLRLGGVLVLSLPAVAAVSLVFLKDQTGNPSGGPDKLLDPPDWVWDVVANRLPRTMTRGVLEHWLWGLTGIAAAITAAVSMAWVLSWVAERRTGRNSPWDMTTVDEQATGLRRVRQQRKQPIDGDDMTFHELIRKLRLQKMAVGVYSAEGRHERYGWDGAAQEKAVELLSGQRSTAENITDCHCGAVAGHDPVP
jgi:hypothetical protein